MKKLLMMAMALFIAMGAMEAQNNILSRIKHMGEENGRMEGKFTETRAYPKSKKKTTEYAEGTFVYFAPDSVAVNYTKPEGDFMIMTEGQLLVRKKGETQKYSVKQATSNRGALKRAWQMACSGELEQLAKELEMKVTTSENAVRLIVKMEKKHMPDSGVCSLLIMYDKVRGGLLYLKIEEVNGNYTLWEMTEVVARKM